MSGYLGHQFGNYRLIKLIGQGGFADVYLGEHIHLNTFAAISILKASLFHHRALCCIFIKPLTLCNMLII